MKLLLIGKSGQLGRALQRTLAPLGHVQCLGRAQMDLASPDAVWRALRVFAPDVIVNAAAYTAVDAAEAQVRHVMRVNAQAPAIMAAWSRQSGALLVQYSTDYVFDGSKAGAYVEGDATCPLNAYGRSKEAAEQAVLASGCACLVFRISWLYSAVGHHFARTIIHLARERDTLRVVDDQVGAPTTTGLVAEVTAHAIAAHGAQRLGPGLYHLTAAGATSRYGWACQIVQRLHAMGCPVRLQPQQLVPVASSAYLTPARRPVNSRLDSRKLEIALGMSFPHWTAALNHLVSEIYKKDRAGF